MDLFSQLTLLLRAKANTLLRPGAPAVKSSAPALGNPAQAASLLKTAEGRAVKVREQLVQAETREQNAEQAWRVARTEADAMEEALNVAVRGGHDEVARTKLTQLNQLQNNVRQLSDRWRNYATTTEKLRIELQSLDAQLTVIRKRQEQAPPAARVKEAEQRLSQPNAHAQTAAKADAQGTSASAKSANAASDATAPADAGKALDQNRIADMLKKRDTQPKP